MSLYDLFQSIASYLHDLAQYTNDKGQELEGTSVWGDALAIILFDVSIACSNLAQVFLDASTVAHDLETRLDSLRAEFDDYVSSFDIIAVVSSVWEDFDEFLQDIPNYIKDKLVSLFPWLADFLADPLDFILNLLKDYLPIAGGGARWERVEVEGKVFYVNYDAQPGDGAVYSDGWGTWRYVSVFIYLPVDSSEMASIWLSFPGTSRRVYSPADGGEEGSIYESRGYFLSGISYDLQSFSLKATTSGVMSVPEIVYIGPNESYPYSFSVHLQSFLGKEYEPWHFDWSGFIDWLIEHFLEFAEKLYRFLERMIRYFFEGVY